MDLWRRFVWLWVQISTACTTDLLNELRSQSSVCVCVCVCVLIIWMSEEDRNVFHLINIVNTLSHGGFIIQNRYQPL